VDFPPFIGVRRCFHCSPPPFWMVPSPPLLYVGRESFSPSRYSVPLNSFIPLLFSYNKTRTALTGKLVFFFPLFRFLFGFFPPLWLVFPPLLDLLFFLSFSSGQRLWNNAILVLFPTVDVVLCRFSLFPQQKKSSPFPLFCFLLGSCSPIRDHPRDFFSLCCPFLLCLEPLPIGKFFLHPPRKFFFPFRSLHMGLFNPFSFSIPPFFCPIFFDPLFSSLRHGSPIPKRDISFFQPEFLFQQGPFSLSSFRFSFPCFKVSLLEGVAVFLLAFWTFPRNPEFPPGRNKGSFFLTGPFLRDASLIFHRLCFFPPLSF